MHRAWVGKSGETLKPGRGRDDGSGARRFHRAEIAIKFRAMPSPWQTFPPPEKQQDKDSQPGQEVARMLDQLIEVSVGSPLPVLIREVLLEKRAA